MSSDTVKRKPQDELEKSLNLAPIINAEDFQMKNFEIESKMDKIPWDSKKINKIHIDISNVIVSFLKFSKKITSLDSYSAEESNISEEERQEFKYILKQELDDVI